MRAIVWCRWDGESRPDTPQLRVNAAVSLDHN